MKYLLNLLLAAVILFTACSAPKNKNQEEAVEETEAQFNFDRLAVGFNVTYLLDALMAIDTEKVSLELKDANSSCLVSAPDSDVNRHVVMPLKL